MRFLDREEELGRLDRLTATASGGLAVVYGRRRIGKTRLLVEWSQRHEGVYSVADQSAVDVQRRYLAQHLGQRLPDFGDVEYPDWQTLFSRLARDAQTLGFKGPVVLDELPYLVASSPELPSLLQRFCDHDATRANLVLAIAGSSQRMMQGLVLSADAPLYGRASVVLDLQPLRPGWLVPALGTKSAIETVENWAAWGGVPRYLELAREIEGSARERIDELVLDPHGPLHREPDRLLLEEVPSAVEVRPVLDAIGAGAHRVSEIAGRLGRPATSMSRPLERLVEMGLVERQVPFGEPPRKSRRSLYRIRDPLFRLWFRVVAPNRAQLATGTRAARRAILAPHWSGLVAQSWEDLCRSELPRGGLASELGPLSAASRWWRGNAPEWDVVAEGLERDVLWLGEAKWSDRPLTLAQVKGEAQKLARKALPTLGRKYEKHEIVRGLMVPQTTGRIPKEVEGVRIVRARELIARA